MKPDRRGSWYLLTGLVLGVAAGLVYSWLISPVNYVDAPPSALRAGYKDDYRALVASAYLYSNDLLRANERLAQLKDDNPAQALMTQAQRALAENRPDEEIRALRELASALNGEVPPGDIFNSPTVLPTSIPFTGEATITPLMNTSTNTLTVTLFITPTPMNILLQILTSTALPTKTATPTSTPGAPFILQETHMVCDVNHPEPLIEVDVRDAAGKPVPSVEVLVTWQGGADHFFTGLQPELGLGYGDFAMLPDMVYSVQIASGGQPVSSLTAAACVAEDGNTYWGSWYLVFVQP